jgi:multiple sugar transport system substrate-binding protein
MNILYINKKMVFIVSLVLQTTVIFTGLINSLNTQKEQVTLALTAVRVLP